MDVSYEGKPCPKCSYKRTELDSSPQWQCPNCGVVYVKFLQTQSAPAPAPAIRRTAGVESAANPAVQSSGLAMFAHLSILGNLIVPLMGIVVPIVIWVIKSDKDEMAVASAKEALNFQISVSLWALAVGLPVLLMPPWFMAAILVWAVLALALLILPIIATVKVAGANTYYYPITLHIFGDAPIE